MLALPIFLVGCGGSVAAAGSPSSAALSIQPSQVEVAPGGKVQFAAAFGAGSPSTITWTASGGGVIASTGASSAQFVAGDQPGTFSVTVSAELPSSSDPLEATASVHIATAPSGAGSGGGQTSSSSARIFSSSAADWLYSAPTGSSLNISSITRNMSFGIHTHQDGFDYPVQYTDGTHGCTTFNDYGHWDYDDQMCVPNPANGYWPSTGAWGADDGHLVVLDTSTGNYYDFWKLLVNSKGQPTSTNVGSIRSGNVRTGNGSPGTTAADITGLAGDILPGELDCVTCLDHALSVVVPGSMNSPQKGTQAPVDHSDGTVSGGIFREGAKIRLDPSVDVASLQASTAAKAIMLALQKYGGLITDQTGASGISFYTGLSTPPDLTGINQIGAHLLIYY